MKSWQLVDRFAAVLLCILLALIIFPGLRLALKELVQKVVA